MFNFFLDESGGVGENPACRQTMRHVLGLEYESSAFNSVAPQTCGEKEDLRRDHICRFFELTSTAVLQWAQLCAQTDFGNQMVAVNSAHVTKSLKREWTLGLL